MVKATSTETAKLRATGLFTLQWRHNGRDSVSNHQPHDCLLNRLFRRKSQKTSKLRVTGLCVGNSPGTGEFPAQMASYAENVSIWWRHHYLWESTVDRSIPLTDASNAGRVSMWLTLWPIISRNIVVLSILKNEGHFVDAIFKIFVYQNCHNLIQICSSIRVLLTLTHLPHSHMYASALVQIMACRLFGTKPFPESALTYCEVDPQEQTSVKFESKYNKSYFWIGIMAFSFKKMQLKLSSAKKAAILSRGRWVD